MRSIRRRTEGPSPGVVVLRRATETPAWAAACACALLVSAVACKQPLGTPVPAAHPDDTTPRRGGVLRLASIGSASSIDPAVAADAVARPVMQALFDGLIDYDEAGKIVPVLASRWEVADGGTTYRFFLREGVKFHDGSELTAADVKRTAERALHKDTPNPAASTYENLVGYKAFHEGKAEHLEGVVVESKYVVSYRVAEPDATFLSILTLHGLRPLCPSAGDRYSDRWHPCGTGPFVLPKDGWDTGIGVTLARNEGYFRPGLPYLDGIRWSFAMNKTTERFKFEAGEIDIIRDLGAADVLRFQRDPRWAPFGEAESDRSVFGEGMNTRMAPFDNVHVRRAVAAAINRDHYVALGPGSLRAANQLIPPMVAGYNPAIVGQTYDYAAALEEMKKAGYAYDPATGEGGYPETIVYTTYTPGLLEYTAQLLQQDLAKIGLRIRIRLVSWAAYLALQRKEGLVAFGPASWSYDYPDPSNFFEPLFSTAAINPESSNNSSFFSNPRLDQILERARRELDAEKRQALYDEANGIVCDQAPWAFTHYYHWYEVHQPYVRGYKAHPVWLQNVAFAWLDRAP